MGKEYRLGDVLISREEIAKRTAELAAKVAADTPLGGALGSPAGPDGKRELVVVGILTGAVFFLTDLVRQMPEDMDVRVDFMSVSSYGNATKSSGVVRIFHDLKTNIEGKHVLVVEDIVDTGRTFAYLLELLQSRRPASLRTCVLLDKSARREVEVEVDYCGFSIPDAFVVGCGLDCAGMWRHLKDIRTVVEP
ncbi:MAG: hypoxanthine phosphoribosyltransferase [Synergistaceae bacterium]|nr:hypoxanthine phosphoribosyltransferase [Synergistaceae bacterium]